MADQRRRVLLAGQSQAQQQGLGWCGCWAIRRCSWRQKCTIMGLDEKGKGGSGMGGLKSGSTAVLQAATVTKRLRQDLEHGLIEENKWGGGWCGC